MKFEKSTKREPSEWEREDSSSPFPSAHSSKSKGSQTGKKRVAQTPLKQESKKSCSNKYLLMFHPDFRQYIQDTMNVQSDGNCGYRALALSIFGNDNAWMKVRTDLSNFLQQHSEFFSNMYAKFYEGWSKCEDLYVKALNSLNVCSSTKFAPKDKWLDLPFFSSLIATKYQIILVNVGEFG
ncbi:hypothetical protein RIF29_24460 [Crotalaria pallida]|uniref:OTU domain-containing protein n=1 Tax=Crotalaria pallida TaxID=3830 RepID=A0AAN9EJQ6_CROPI